jgi:purine-binding chemotaxis protein CheW
MTNAELLAEVAAMRERVARLLGEAESMDVVAVASSSEAPHQALVFTLDGRPCALAARDVEELIPTVAITPLPGAPPIVEGLMNVRGEIVPLIDLRRRLGLPERPLDHEQVAILTRAGDRRIAVRVDEAIELRSIDAAQVAGAEKLALGSTCVAGVARTADGLLLIYDVETFLTAAEAETLDRALAALEEASIS